MSLKLVLSAALVLVNLTSVFGASWSHEEGVSGLYGPSEWGHVAEACDGKRQSPIDIVTRNARRTSSSSILQVSGHEKLPSKITYKNDGHGISATYEFSDSILPSVTGGPLGSNKYGLVNVHLHWPSEHRINGKLAVAEVHIVHYNMKYANVSEAASKSDGLAVVGVLLNVNTKRTFVRPYYKAAEVVRSYGSASYYATGRSNVYALKNVFYPENALNSVRIWSYLGSLTVPTCNEAVTWLVSREYLSITQAELDILKQLQTAQGTPNKITNRPVQALNGRTVTIW